MPEPTDREMCRALKAAEALSTRFVSSASKFRLTEADTLDVIAISRFLLRMKAAVDKSPHAEGCAKWFCRCTDANCHYAKKPCPNAICTCWKADL